MRHITPERLKEDMEEMLDDYSIEEVLRAVSNYFRNLESTTSDEQLFHITADMVDGFTEEINKTWKEWDG